MDGSHFFVLKFYCCSIGPKISGKEAEDGPFKKVCRYYSTVRAKLPLGLVFSPEQEGNQLPVAHQSFLEGSSAVTLHETI